MSTIRNVFISHIHEDDDLLPSLRDLVSSAGMEVRDASINSEKPNEASSPDYIKNEILAPRIQWASTLVVLISHDTADSEWVNWEIDYAAKEGKTIVGVFARGATNADVPDALRQYGDAAIVGWQGDRIVAAINGELQEWDAPSADRSGSKPAVPQWQIERHQCR